METSGGAVGLTTPEHAARISGRNGVVGNIFRHDGTGADKTSRSDSYSRHDECARAHKRIFADRDFRRNERLRGLRKVMATAAQIHFLRDGGAGADFDFAKAIDIGTIAENGAVTQR